LAKDNTFYITTPIYYPSDKLHIGHSYTTVAADAMARFKRLTGKDVMFLTGTDEHGQKIERTAKEHGMDTKEYVDGIVDGIKKLWDLLDISYDDFIRTTETRHKEAVQKIFKKLYDQGDIYKSEYQGWYCTPCESFWTQRQLADGNCPDCARKVEMVSEEGYFFRLSKYQDALIEHIKTDCNFLKPQSRCNEMLNNFLLPGLEDLCVSRSSFKWGIPVSFDDKHVIYVWIDALSNYITALGYMSSDASKYERFWPANVQLVGKEIVRFHTIIWPAMLLALGEPLPKQVFGHGWLILEGGKMSKSKGNVIDPVVLSERYGVDAIRYFLLRELPFGADGVFSNEALLNRINSDLVNDLGNLVNRTVAMIERYFKGIIPNPSEFTSIDRELIEMALSTPVKVEMLMDDLQFSNALSEIWKLIGRANKYIDETAPWALAKDANNNPRLATVMYCLGECIRFVSVLVSPVLTRTPEKIREQLGINDPSLTTWESLGEFGKLPFGSIVNRKHVIFPRLDIKAELAELRGEKENGGNQVEIPAENELRPQEIDIDHFKALDLRVAFVQEAERVPKSDKLLKLTLRVGSATRQVVAGIAKEYAPEDIIGKSIILLANLKPAKLRGVLSEGMLMAASDDEGKLSLLTIDRPISDGSKIS